MTDPILPPADPGDPELARAITSGEGALTALAAMIRKRKMGENHVEADAAQALPQPASSEP
jgi:hypothetical protein